MNHLEVTLTSACPMMCSYCPQKNYIKGYQRIGSPKKMMGLQDYIKILDNVNYAVNDIHFTGFSEPLLNAQWHDIVLHTIEKGYKVKINTTLYKATSQDIENLANFGVPVRIHLTDSDKRVDPKIYKEFLLKYKGEINFDFFSEKGKAIIPHEVDATFHAIQSRGNNLDIEHRVIPGAVSCASNRQYSNVILPNGDVSVCCSDFGLEHILGNLMTSSLQDIHNSAKMQDFNTSMNRCYNKNFICKHCHYARPKEKEKASTWNCLWRKFMHSMRSCFL